MRPAKTRISRGTSNLIGVFVVCMKKHWVLCYPLSGQRSLCSDWSDVQADSLGAQVILLVLLCCGSNWWGDQKWATKVAEVLTIEISSSYFESQITYGSYESRHEKNCLAYPTGIFWTRPGIGNVIMFYMRGVRQLVHDVSMTILTSFLMSWRLLRQFPPNVSTSM